MSILNETYLEQHIADYLSASPLYNQRSAADFDIDALCDRTMLRRFIEAQSAKWSRLVDRFGGEDVAVEAVVKEYNNRVDKGSLSQYTRKQRASFSSSIYQTDSQLFVRCVTAICRPTIRMNSTFAY